MQKPLPLAQGFNHGERGGHSEHEAHGEHEPRGASGETKRTSARGERLLRRVLYWTNGHPYLTQALCAAAAADAAIGSPHDVDRLVESMFFEAKSRERNVNLADVSNRLLSSYQDAAQKEEHRAAILDLYAQVRGRGKVGDDETNRLAGALKLSGITRSEQGFLQVRNRIYAHVFDGAWIRQNTPGEEQRRQQAAFRAGLLRSGAIASCVVVLLALLAGSALRNARRADINARLADANARRARASEDLAQRESQSARDEFYMAAMNAIPLAWNNHNVGQAQQLLDGAQGYAARGFEWNYWQQMCHQEQHTLYGHKGRVNVVAVSPDGSRIASGGSDQQVRLWDAGSGILLASWPVEKTIWGLSFSPDGKRLVVGTDLNTPCILDTRTGEVQTLLQGHEAGAWAVAFSPDGRRVATGSWDNTVRVWDARTGRQIGKPLTGHTEGVISLAWSPRAEDDRLVSGSSDETARVWNTRTGKEVLPPLGGHRGHLWCVAWSPDGKRIATAGRDSMVKLWNANTGREERTLRRVSMPVYTQILNEKTKHLLEVRSHELAGHTGLVLGVTFSPDSRRVLTTSIDDTAIFWDANTGRALRVLAGHRSEVDGAAFFPDGARVATAGADGVVKVWNALREEALHQLRGHEKRIVDVCEALDGARFASASEDGAVMLWNADVEQRLAALRLPNQRLWAARFMPDGRHLLTAGSLPDNKAQITEWDLQSDKPTRSLPVFLNRGISEESFVRLSLSPDGSRLAACAHTGEVCLIDLRAWRVERLLACDLSLKDPCLLRDACFSPDGALIAGGGDYGHIWIWDAYTGRILRHLSASESAVHCVAFSPDGSLLAASADDGARIWDTRQGTQLHEAYKPDTVWGALAFSPDGRRLIESGSANTIRVVDTRSGREALSLPGCGGSVTALTFASDARRLAAGGSDGVVRVWNMASDAQTAAWKDEERQSFARVAVFTADQEQRERQRQQQLMREISGHIVYANAPVSAASNLLASQGWRLNVNGRSGAVASLRVEADGSPHLVTREKGAQGRDVAVSQRGLRLLPAHGYTLQFRARAERSHYFAVFFQNDLPPQALSGLVAYVNLSPQWLAHRLHVDMTDAALPDHGMITLEFGKEAGDVWLTDLMLVPDPPNPAPAQSRTAPPTR